MATLIRKFREFISPRSASWLVISLLSGLLIAGLAYVQFAHPGFPDPDSYYHTRISNLMASQGLLPEFPYLPLSVLNEREYYDHHYLFHVALMPFTLLDIRLGSKWAAVIFAALAFLSIWNLLRSQRVPYAALWALGLLAVSDAFLYRLTQVRAQSLSLAVLALGLTWMLQRRYARLLPLGFAYVWLYNAFPLLAVLAGAYTVGVLLVERRLELRPLLFASGGLLLGLLINPYFPDNIVFAARHILPKVADATAVDVGNEWFPYQTATLLRNSPLAMAAFPLAALALGLREKRMDAAQATSFLLASGFALMLFQSRRYIEYYPPFVLVFAALAWAPLLRKDNLQAAEPGSSPQAWRLPAWLGPALLLLLVLAGSAYSMNNAHKTVADARPFERYAAAARWLEANTLPGELVFQTDWDDFPRLFFYNTHNTYLIGLDPTYMQLYDAELYELWVDITQGEVDQPSSDIAGRFGARWVHTDLLHRDFIAEAGADPGLREVYRDDDSILYEVVNP